MEREKKNVVERILNRHYYVGDKIRYFGTENRFKIIYIDHELQWVLFYVDKNICSFDPLKISSD